MRYLLLSFLFIFTLTSVNAQQVTLSPSGGNQKASVSQWIGLVKVTVDYSSPDVTDSRGNSRKGKIWGQLVPWGMPDNSNGFGSAKFLPWRAGANDNTVLTVSHDVKVEGKDLPAGSYGIHMSPSEDGNWTIIFSKNTSSWGSYTYTPDEDALRVQVKTASHEYREWLTYEFIDRQADQTTCALIWEELKVPFTIEVPNLTQLYIENMKDELRSTAGFTWQGYNQAANFCLQNNTELELALQWAEASISAPYAGRKNFTTLATKAQVLAKLNKQAEAEKVMEEAIKHPTATMQQVHQYARQLIAQGKKEKALEVFEMNRENNPEDTFTTLVGLARGYHATGNKKKAIKYFKEAAKGAPSGQTEYYNDLAAKIEKGEKIDQ